MIAKSRSVYLCVFFAGLFFFICSFASLSSSSVPRSNKVSSVIVHYRLLIAVRYAIAGAAVVHGGHGQVHPHIARQGCVDVAFAVVLCLLF